MRRAFVGFAVAGTLAFALPAFAQSGESIRNFDTTITIHADASADVVEKIEYDFGTSEHHGIFRDIPVKYQGNLGTVSIDLSNIRVTDEQGQAYEFTTERKGSDEEIRIGDPNAVVTGDKTYVISYRVSRVISYFDKFDELYWNVTGLGWQVPILQASATINLPSDVLGANIQGACYQGMRGSTASCNVLPFPAQTSTVRFATTRPLAASEGMTIALGFPKGVVRQPSRWESVLAFARDNWVVVVPVLVFLGMFVWWWKKGRDPHGRGTIVPEYDSPENLTPLEMYALMHDRVGNSAISSEIIYLATRGYLKITRLEEKKLFLKHSDYQLTRLKSSSDLPPVDKALMDGLFASGAQVTLSQLRNKFYRTASKIKRKTMRETVEKGYFPADPTSVVLWYVLGGAAVLFLSFFLGSWSPLAAICGALSGGIIIGFGLLMPKVTPLGAILRERIKGLRMYMDVAEKARIEFHNAPEKNPALFEKLLPFAMVLGVEAAWAKQFEGIYTQPPSWYYDPQLRGFNAVLFTSDMHAFASGASSALASAPSGSGSGGGGASGGGFGGGGGGSW